MHRRSIVVAVAATVLWFAAPVASQEESRTAVSSAPFATVTHALEQAITDQKMGLVCHANAQRAAAARSVTIKGNQVLMVFRNDFAVRLLAAEPTAGFEAPIRIYVYENPDGTATVVYRPPSVVFARFAHPEVKKIAAELDPIFKAIMDQALSAQ